MATVHETAEAIASIIDRLAAKVITELQAVSELNLALADFPPVASIQEMTAKLIAMIGRIDSMIIVAGPPDNTIGAPGAYWFDSRTGDFFGPKKVTGWEGSSFSLVGSSALQVLINGGILPVGSTAADFGSWLANSQKAAVQPLVDEAKTARDAAKGHKDAAAASAQAAHDDKAATAQDRAATGQDRTATGQDRTATGLDKQATHDDRQATAQDRSAAAASATAAARKADDAFTAAQASSGAANASGEALGLARDARDAAQASAQAAGQDADKTAADRQATAADRIQTGQDRQTATQKAADAAASVQSAEAIRVATAALRDAAQTFRNEAKDFRDQASEIAGGDFLTESEADTLYRKLGDALVVGDVDGLNDALADIGAALSGKQDKLGFTPEDAAKKGVAGGYAGLDADAKIPSALINFPAPPTVPVKAAASDLRVGTNDAKFATAKSVADAVATVAVTPAAATAGLDFSTFINAEISVTANLTLGPPSGGFARKTGEIDIVQDATGGRAVAFHANYIVPANFSLQATANGRTSIPYRYQADGKVRLYNPSKWVA